MSIDEFIQTTNFNIKEWNKLNEATIANRKSITEIKSAIDVLITNVGENDYIRELKKKIDQDNISLQTEMQKLSDMSKDIKEAKVKCKEMLKSLLVLFTQIECHIVSKNELPDVSDSIIQIGQIVYSDNANYCQIRKDPPLVGTSENQKLEPEGVENGQHLYSEFSPAKHDKVSTKTEQASQEQIIKDTSLINKFISLYAKTP